ncbi:MAG: hypothetical protein QF486_01435 [Candidatus Woesearchaeota archaeon]|nr:hypothetical protein [Candidatus Woesearchaeota archaeon]MDP7181123.1 hypothetical protein [Candidatus Woesearchaeota archaeon]MDP7198256.1 hypothetical protein [Candidatus Woesearchaeota archaeon]MDP7467092.1 hypothetical protein [Candidatus Woesearchaeota archaeon]MDP7646761.1 hypothetical protein [Candidatus Woesearchaeota archaeon]
MLSAYAEEINEALETLVMPEEEIESVEATVMEEIEAPGWQYESVDITEYWAMPDAVDATFYYDLEVPEDTYSDGGKSYTVTMEEKMEVEIEDAKIAYALGSTPDTKGFTVLEQEHRKWWKKVNQLWMFMTYDLLGL